MDDLTVTYNAAGRVATQAGVSTTTTFGYDSKGRLGSRTDLAAGTGFTSSYTYDADDQLVSVVYPSGRTVAYEHDVEQRLTAIRQNGAVFAHFTYDDAGRPSGYTTGAVTHTLHIRRRRPARAQSVVQCGRRARSDVYLRRGR